MSMNREMDVKEEKDQTKEGCGEWGGGLTGGSCDTQTLTNLFYSECGVAVIPDWNHDLVVWEILTQPYSLHWPHPPSPLPHPPTTKCVPDVLHQLSVCQIGG